MRRLRIIAVACLLAPATRGIVAHSDGPTAAQEALARGNTRLGSGDFAGAVSEFTRALELDSRLVLAYDRRAQARTEMGDVNGALADCTRAIDIDPSNFEAFYQRGIVKRWMADLEGALSDFTVAMKLDPASAAARSARGSTRYEKGNLTGAVSDYDAALRLDANCAFAYKGRAAIREMRGDLDGALADALRSTDLAPKDARAWGILGLVRFERRDLEGARKDLDRALEIEPRLASAYETRAHLEWQARDFEAASRDYKKVADLDKARSEVQFLRYYSRILAGEPPAAATKELLDAIRRAGTALKEGSLEWSLAQVLLGRLTEDEVLKRSDDGLPATREDLRCDLLFGLGMLSWVKGEGTHATALLRRCLETERTTRATYLAAERALTWEPPTPAK